MIKIVISIKVHSIIYLINFDSNLVKIGSLIYECNCLKYDIPRFLIILRKIFYNQIGIISNYFTPIIFKILIMS